MRSKSDYRLIHAEDSTCPVCKSSVYLLASDRLSPSPAFFICFGCKFVGESGVGAVPLRRETRQ